MKSLKKMCTALESVPGFSELLCVWKELAGTDFHVLMGYLRPTRDISDSYPCPKPGGEGCPRRVVFHDDDDIVAVCGNSPPDCDPVKLTKADLIVYELDVKKFFSQLNAYLGFRTNIVPVKGLCGAWSTGEYIPVAGKSFNVYFVIPSDASGMMNIVSALTSSGDTEIIVITPTKELCHRDVVRHLKNRQCLLLAIEDVFFSDGNGGITAALPPEEILAEFNSKVLPSQEEKDSSMVIFDTPPDARWEDVIINFQDGHRVSVSAKGVSGTYHYSQMGMVSRRNGKPTKQWELLRQFADEPGHVLDWKSAAADHNNKKRKQLLSKNLREFFRLETDPFMPTADGKGWMPRFLLNSD